MNAGRFDVPWSSAEHLQNVAKFPAEELAKYVGRFVAWSWDGARILDSAEDRERLWEQLVAAGIDPHRVVFEFIAAG